MFADNTTTLIKFNQQFSSKIWMLQVILEIGQQQTCYKLIKYIIKISIIKI